MSEDFNTTWARWKKVIADTAALNRGAVLKALGEIGVKTLTVGYDGSGDSGQIDSFTYEGEVSGKDLDARAGRKSVEVLPSPGYGAESVPSEPKPATLQDAVERLCYDFLAVHHGGWENNEGACGTFIFDVEKGTLTLEHNERVIEYHTTEHDL